MQGWAASSISLTRARGGTRGAATFRMPARPFNLSVKWIAGFRQRYLPGTDLRQDRADEFVLDLDRQGTFGRSLVEDIQRLADRRLGIRGTKMLQPQGVAQQARNARTESIELGEGVLADGDQRPRPHD
jgi:hypothetical protein